MAEDLDALVSAKLATLRGRLLDRTTRNPLLSFKHHARSGRFVRIVDEVPNLLFERLERAAGSFRFRSLGEGNAEPADERELGFRRALEAAKLQDEQYLEAMRNLGEDAGGRAVAAIEQQLRLRLRERLGMPPRPEREIPDPVAVARGLGIDPSYDLPVAPSGHGKHQDGLLQTLLFEEQLQATLGKLRERVRLSLSESGIHPLFAVFGFLEWYDKREPQRPHQAPLLVYPLRMERELVRGKYRYEVEAADDGMLSNPALRARLREDFGVELPEFGEEQTPEDYFGAVQGIVAGLSGWRVRRCVTVALLSFAKIAMFNDLDPARWSPEAPLHGHPLLRRLLAGDPGANASGPATEPPTVSPAAELPLVAEADSSQRAAIADVLAGRSLVIEGPPGTGKSQTITNLIAAALAQGKSVLFLAEKMAALQVVKDRLVALGLGEFCLELHSTRAGRDAVVRQVRSRLELSPQGFSEAQLSATRRELQVLEQSLGDTVAALAAPAGELGMTVHELLWQTTNLRRATADCDDWIHDLRDERALARTDLDVDRAAQAAARLEQLTRALRVAAGELPQHPWLGIAHPDLGVLQVQDLARTAGQLAEAARAAEQLLGAIAGATGAAVRSLADLLPLLAVQQFAVDLPASAFALAAAAAAEPLRLQVLRRFTVDLGEERDLRRQLAPVFATAASLERIEPAAMRRLAELVAAVGSAAGRLGDLAAAATAEQQRADQLGRGVALLGAAAQSLQLPAPATAAEQQAWHGVLEALATVDGVLFEQRTAALCVPGATAVLARVLPMWRTLRERRQQLATEFSLAALPEPAQLRAHAAVLRQPPALRWLRASWRAAWAALGQLALRPLRLDRYAAALRLDELAAFAEDRAAFTAQPALQALGSGESLGLDSDLPALHAVAQWADAVREAAGSEALAAAVLAAPVGKLAELRRLALAAERAALASWLPGTSEPLEAVQRRALRTAECCSAAAQLAEKVELVPTVALAEVARLAEQVMSWRDRQRAAAECQVAAEVLGSGFRGCDTDSAALVAALDYVDGAQRLGLPTAVRTWLLRASDGRALAQLRQFAAQVATARAQLGAAVTAMQALAAIDWQQWLRAAGPEQAPLADLQHAAAAAAAAPEALAQLVEYLRLQRELRTEGFAAAVARFAAEPRLRDYSLVVRRIVHQSAVRQVIEAHPCLAGFAGSQHDDKRSRYAELDRRLAELLRKQLRARLTRRSAPEGNGSGPRSTWTDLALLHNECGKEKRYIPVRDLVARAGTALQRLMPCFLMSPLSIAQYLPQHGLQFDLVVMDEASQLRPQDALGGIARGQQVVIVGDPQQLPPTGFFMAGVGETDDEEEPDHDVVEESILDLGLQVLRPARRLTWHYRSRHPSLIEFSNQHFYDGKLVAFPAPYDRHQAFGVHYVHVADGVYGKSLNEPEARAVVEAAVRFATEHPGRSLGIVALNSQQAELIALLVDRLAAEQPEFENWRKSKDATLEPFFVKNLENVQGDERDVIFISTVYGKDAKGAMYQRFGPINGQGGHRRLNVLFTRAKYQVVVFSSMQPADVMVTEQSSAGVRALRGYLEFARDGWSVAAVPTGRGAESPFEAAVGTALAAAGFAAVPQVGVSGYRIDLAVRHPERPGEFALGIECDGRTYHSAQSTRDRDRLRQEILQRLGWRIHRIWSVDWYGKPQQEQARLLAAVQEAIGR